MTEGEPAPPLADTYKLSLYRSDSVIEDKYVGESIEILEGLDPTDLEYWLLRSEVVEVVAINTAVQFSRGKYDQGLLNLDYLREMFQCLREREEEVRLKNLVKTE